jgi:glycosyltransferase involved in cell wall biosynthesis
MKLMLELLALSIISEFLVVFFLRGNFKKIMAGSVLSLISFIAGGMIVTDPNIFSLLIGLISIYRIVNLMRVVQSRTNETYLKWATRNTSVWLVGAQALLFLAWLFQTSLYLSIINWWLILACLQVLLSLGLLYTLVSAIKSTKAKVPDKGITDDDLPTVTVAIPARNEDKYLEGCLKSLLASDYPKLEVIVLDDCSQDRTSQIIRSFARSGVRFIKGGELRENTLAKNQAYAQLAKEANGEILLFCGVDVRFSWNTLRQLVSIMTQNHKSMICVLPLNMQPKLSLIQAMRYFWELAPPRNLFKRLPVLGTCWLITSRKLKKSGGFGAVNRSITPEAYFARASTEQDGYCFLRSDNQIGLTSAKLIHEQVSTAVRTRYPQLHRRPEVVLLIGVLELIFLVAPFVQALLGVLGFLGYLTEFVSIASCCLLVIGYYINNVAFLNKRLLLSLTMPFAILLDVALLNMSMIKYEFSIVLWKGRNICIPVMRVYDHLPKSRLGT